jgi:hypothetical protein
MSITTTAALEAAIDGRYSTFIGSKAAVTNTGAGQFFSLWTVAGLPGTGAIPTATPVILTNATTGAFNFTQQTAPSTSYLEELSYTSGNVGAANIGSTLEIHDRLVHMGGLSGNTSAVQTITGFDLSTLSGSNLTKRIGDSNYSDVQWWLQIYTDIGSTNSSATVNVTYNDGTTGNLTVFNIGNNDRRLGRMFPLAPQIPAADQGKFIRGINSVTCAPVSGTAGNFGFVATRYRAAIFAEQPIERYTVGWTKTSLAEIYNSSCLSMIVLCTTTTGTGTTTVSGRIIHG